MKMKTGTEFLETFKANGITHNAKDKRHQDTLDFQDFVMNFNSDGLYAFYSDLNTDQKRLFIWACTNTLHFDSCVDIIKSTTLREERQKLYAEFNEYATEREVSIYKKEEIFNDCKKQIYRKIRNLNNEIESLKNRIAVGSAKQ
jgi:hypothetical protein